MNIVEGMLDDPRIIDLVEFHATSTRAVGCGYGHSFFIDRLRQSDIRFWSVWLDGVLSGIGALKSLSFRHGEIKSMHTVAAARGTGVGHALLTHIEGAAREMGIAQLNLETHPGDYFAPAIALYRKHGFIERGPFGDYRLDPSSMFMTKTID